MDKEAKTKILEVVLGILTFTVILGLGVYLFFGDSISYRLGNNDGFSNKAVSRSDDEVLKIWYVFPVKELDPVLFDPVTRGWMTDLYETLVVADENLNIRPSLASTWGLIDPYTWEFMLRKDVKFHDGKSLAIGDVVYSINRAIGDDKSQLKSLLNTIEKVEAVDAQTIRIITGVPDPLLLSKIATVYIIPEGYGNFASPIGTGPYKSAGFLSTELDLERFDGYWGNAPAFKSVILKVISDREARITALNNGEINFLVNMPPNYGCAHFNEYKDIKGCKAMDGAKIVVKDSPGLEVSFLAFNTQKGLFSDQRVRKAVSLALDPEVFKTIAFGFAVPARQFVSSGVFGFNPAIQPARYDLAEAKSIMDEVIGGSFERIAVTFDYPESLPPVGAYVKAQFKELGVDVDLNPLSDAELTKQIMGGKSDFYYMGWRSELGDASDFLLAAVHTKDQEAGYGSFNGFNYSNKEVDGLIEASQKNLDTQSRLAQLQKAMKIITEEDIIGVPLFESEVLYAYAEDIKFTSRVDGYVYAANIK